jgi:hypothetical protein
MSGQGTPPLLPALRCCARLSAVPHAAPALYHTSPKGSGSARLTEAPNRIETYRVPPRKAAALASHARAKYDH